ncbi:sigma-70 family RNA polymerase sigma factor [Paenibacillus sp. DMB20]|uniref:sigma-70 family RNA polymerase sigma factor n=1 Tax=Paenibacillus sp. DMB20 TaxID=1642570 RepID=UPI000ADEE057|nr:sigma-70 family RNA polymerase sigma factor [Paenibacillus sp. DMB20]
MLEETYAEYKPRLFGLAYRMLGSAADAEDMVQDVFAQYMVIDKDEVRNEQAYLMKMTANRCINLIRSSRKRRETYVGPWLPEPLPDADREGQSDPAERREQVGYAYLVMLQQLTPLERTVYITKETLGFEYRDIAEMLDKTELSCRKTFSRAGRKMKTLSGGSDAFPSKGADPGVQDRFVEAFLRASDTGNFKPLVAFLMEEVTLVSDGGGKARAALNPILGLSRVQAFFEGLAAKGRFREGFVPAGVNGELCLLLKNEGRIAWAICPEWEPGGSRIRKLYLIVNPDKLRRFN